MEHGLLLLLGLHLRHLVPERHQGGIVTLIGHVYTLLILLILFGCFVPCVLNDEGAILHDGEEGHKSDALVEHLLVLNLLDLRVKVPWHFVFEIPGDPRVLEGDLSVVSAAHLDTAESLD